MRWVPFSILTVLTPVSTALVVDFGEEAIAANDASWDGFNIQLGDAHLPMSAASKKGNDPQLRVNKKEDADSFINADKRRSKEDSSEKRSKGSKKGEKIAKIPDDLFRSHSPTPVPMPTIQPPHGSTMLPSIYTLIPSSSSSGHDSERASHIPHPLKKKGRYDDDDDDDGYYSEGNHEKKAKYAGVALPPTYNEVKEKFVGPDAGESMKPLPKLSPHKDKDGKTHYVDDHHYESGSKKTYYKKSKREDGGSSKGSSAKLQKNKQEPKRPPMHRMTHSPMHPTATTPTPSLPIRPPSEERPTLMPAVMSNDEPAVTSRSLSSFFLSFVFVQSRIPSNPEIFELVAVIGAFLESRLDMMYPGITVLLTIANTNFRLMQPFEVILDITVENIPAPPASMVELDAAVEMIFQEPSSLEALLSVIENLPATNVFQTTSAVAFDGPSVSSAPASSRSKNVVGVSAAAGVLAVLLLVGGGYRQWGKNKSSSGQSPKDYAAVISGSNTITGETCGVTTVATTSKQTRFAFDEAMSFTSRSEWMSRRGEQLTNGNDEEEIDFSGIRPLFSDANADNEAEKRVDLLARSDMEPQPSGDSVGDDLTVDSYVPLRVVDLIKHFSPGRR